MFPKTQSFQKLFVGGYLFAFVEYLCNRSPKIETKNMKNYSSILATANHRNWLDDSPPLMSGLPIKIMIRETLHRVGSRISLKWLSQEGWRRQSNLITPI